MKKKTMALVLALVLVVGGVVGGTLAWLMDSTDPVVNTFTHGDVDITLQETDNGVDKDGNVNTNDYQMIPGNKIDKDPNVTVLADSEACWVFVKIEESDNLDNFLTYAIADGWTLYNVTAGTAIDTITEDDYVIYRAVEDFAEDKTFQILAGTKNATSGAYEDQVTVKDTVTKEMMDALAADTDLYPTLTFTAHAVQQANLDVEAAYAVAFPTPAA